MFKEIWRFLFPEPKQEDMTNYDRATERWTERNERERQAGCKCGRPGTRVKYFGGNIGGVPVHFYSCDEHFGVTQWHGYSNGPLIPSNNLTDEQLRAEGYMW